MNSEEYITLNTRKIKKCMCSSLAHMRFANYSFFFLANYSSPIRGRLFILPKKKKKLLFFLRLCEGD